MIETWSWIVMELVLAAGGGLAAGLCVIACVFAVANAGLYAYGITMRHFRKVVAELAV